MGANHLVLKYKYLIIFLSLFTAYFTTTVQMVYNLLYYQIVAQVSCGLTSAERERVAADAKTGGIKNLSDALNLINECLGQTDLYMEDDSTTGKPEVNILALEQQVNYILFQIL